ncbi:MAG: DUF4234 domain-containing protein [Oscillospiraceae bacterium]|nr:DUF4234 domain-containing protein [Oscillospiraceae bacterium]
MFCPRCGTQIDGDASFCPKCGASLNGDVGKQFANAANDVIHRTEDEFRNAVNDINRNVSGGGYNSGYHGGYDPGYGGVRLKDDRSLLIYILLSIVTCGIYSYYFIYNLASDVNTACEGDGKETAGLVAFILLSIVTCGFYSWYWYYQIGNRLAENAPRYGMQFQENGTTVLLWCVFGAFVCGIGPYIAMNILMKNANAICHAYNVNNGLA